MRRLWQQWTVLVVSYAIVIAFAMFQGSAVSSYVLYTVTLVFFYCIGLLLYPLRDVRIERQWSQREAVVGQTLTVTFIAKRRFAWPLFSLSLEQQSSVEDVHLHRYPLFSCTWQETYQVDLHQRGEWRFAPLRLVVRDLFGFVEREVIVGEEEVIIVYPAMLATDTALAAALSGQGSRDILSPFHQPSNVVTGIREYQRGDRFTWIDWKATARKEELVTKEFAQEQGEHYCFIIDEAPSVHFEAFISFIASYGIKMLQHRHQLVLDSYRYQSLAQQQAFLYQLAMIGEGKRTLATKIGSRQGEEEVVVLTSSLHERLTMLPLQTSIWFVHHQLTKEDEVMLEQLQQRYDVKLIVIRPMEVMR